MNNETFPENSASFLTALFKNPQNAENIYNDLLKKGYKKEDITLMMSDEVQKKFFSSGSASENVMGTKTLQGLGVGGAVGGTVGAIAAALAAAGTSLVIPGLGIVVAGALAASLAGAGAGAAAGGLVGALVGAGIPEAEVKNYEEGIKGGGVVIGVTPLTSNDYVQFKEEWKSYSEE
ncbi:MAG: hypothetical protein H0X26_04245 [Alphaproteobacteria bacterium]|nr:hypothetical protein [Alphaproteobacteria bacterium]